MSRFNISKKGCLRNIHKSLMAIYRMFICTERALAEYPQWVKYLSDATGIKRVPTEDSSNIQSIINEFQGNVQQILSWVFSRSAADIKQVSLIYQSHMYQSEYLEDIKFNSYRMLAQLLILKLDRTSAAPTNTLDTVSRPLAAKMCRIYIAPTLFHVSHSPPLVWYRSKSSSYPSSSLRSYGNPFLVWKSKIRLPIQYIPNLL